MPEARLTMKGEDIGTQQQLEEVCFCEVSIAVYGTA